jgi:undecaprenyl-diphosphatase
VLSHFQAVILGLVQGISELFPISSLGHSVLLPGLLGWSIDQDANYFLTFIVATHFGTALALFVVYRKDWVKIIAGVCRSIRRREIKGADADAKLGGLLIVGTVPAGVAGIVFQKPVQHLLASPSIVAAFLVLNGGLLYAAEMLRRRTPLSVEISDPDRRIASEISWWQSAKIGMMQVIALLPGFSRTGSTLAGGLLAGLSHEDALRFSFLLGTPIIGAAALLKLPGLFHSGSSAAIHNALLGALCAAIATIVAVKILTRHFRTKTLTPFAIYCVLFGSLSLLLLG